MYVGVLAQDTSVAEAWAPWVVSVWQYYRNETPPQDLVLLYAYGIASGRTTPENIMAIAQGG